MTEEAEIMSIDSEDDAFASAEDIEATSHTDLHMSNYQDIVDYLNTHQPDPDSPSSAIAYEKRRRLAAIIEFARTQQYKNQNALAEYLNDLGLGCAQGQLSKDLAALGLTPYVDRRGVRRLGRREQVYKYHLAERYAKVFFEAVFDARQRGSNVLIETLPGCGQAVATVVEASMWPGVDAVFCGLSSVCIMTPDDVTAARILDCVKEGIL